MSRLQKELRGELGEFWKKDAKKRVAEAKQKFETEMTVKDGVVRNCIGRVIMEDFAELLEEAGCQFDKTATAKARAEETAKAIAEYKKNEKAPSAEEMYEMYEMRAAFGEGAEIIDVFTGRKIKL